MSGQPESRTEVLWAPWRMEYIRHAGAEECIFCSKPLEEKDEENLILFRGCRAFVMLNIFPYSNSHLLIAPYAHIPDLVGLERETRCELMDLCARSTVILSEAIRPEGFNIGVNLGRPAGAGIVDHVHFHVVPRWTGDTNFMVVLGATKVIAQHLQDTYAELKPRFDSMQLEA